MPSLSTGASGAKAPARVNSVSAMIAMIAQIVNVGQSVRALPSTLSLDRIAQALQANAKPAAATSMHSPKTGMRSHLACDIELSMSLSQLCQKM
jgi:hypothetical protein